MVNWPRVRRPRGSPRPSAPVAVVLASVGQPLSPAAVARAARLAEGGAVAVVSIARVHGSAFGLPNPGLMPSPAEREEQRGIVSDAIEALGHLGVPADGEVVITRNPAKAFTRVARTRGARHVVLESPRRGRIRRFLEGDPEAALRRRLPSGTLVSLPVSPAQTP